MLIAYFFNKGKGYYFLVDRLLCVRLMIENIILELLGLLRCKSCNKIARSNRIFEVRVTHSHGWDLWQSSEYCSQECMNEAHKFNEALNNKAKEGGIDSFTT